LGPERRCPVTISSFSVTILSYQGLKFHYLSDLTVYLSDLTVSISIVTLSYISQLTHAMTQQNLMMVLNIHESGDTTDRFLGQIS
jgi:hypothetical protein